MTRIPALLLMFSTLLALALSGCTTSTPSTLAPAKPTAVPTQPMTPVSDAAKKEDERFRRELEAKRRKSKSSDIDKTNAYKNYIP